MPWSTSDRRDRLPPDWRRRVAAVRQRAGGRCEATENGQRCPLAGAECDHRRRGDDHRLENLQWLCPPHHAAKTQAEAAAARAKLQAKARHPVPRHPGLS